MTGRIPCCVPFCRRTIAADRIPPDHEWLCSRHWGLVPQATKRRRRQLKRRVQRLKRMWDGNPKGQASIENSGRYFRYCAALARAHQLVYDAWDTSKRDAIERAGGIG